MTVQITIPSPGESITEVVLGPWQKSSGSWVEKDENLVEIESDKVTLEVAAALPFPVDGRSITAIQSYFGAERDAGARAHEGVDIFADRLTPVLAVTDGRATPSWARAPAARSAPT